MVRLLEGNGNKVIRANYQGDVGLHIAKCLYGILRSTKYAMPAGRQEVRSTNLKTIHEKIQFLAEAYVAGNKAYEEDEKAKEKINTINNQIYAKDPEIYPMYEQTRAWSLEYFDSIYKRLGSHFDRFYFESETYGLGKKLVLEFVEKGIFEKDEGAVIFPGEKYGLHNRVFITSEGNATYEGKDIGLAKLQFSEYRPDQIIHCVSTEQIEYFRVIFEAIAHVFPETKGKEFHLIYGWVRLKTGKMSSRSGNVVLGEWLLDEVKKEIQGILIKGDRGYPKKEQDSIAEKAAVAAVKYAFLKVSTPQEIAFDIKESININGDSGPYLLYTYARCKSVLQKSGNSSVIVRSGNDEAISIRKIASSRKAGLAMTLNQEEHDVARLLLYFPEIVEEAGRLLAPNTLCSYLFHLAQAFNLFYAKHEILGNNLRIMLTEKTAETLKKGLYLLGIETVERM
jgi:arginyl-tRNA synthetase